jgi:hypothetical protein
MRLLPILTLSLLALISVGCSDSTGTSDDASIKIVNESSVSLAIFYYGPCSSIAWGSNKLTSPIEPGKKRTFKDITPGCYDMRISNLDESMYAERTVTLEKNQLLTWTITS